MANPIYFITSEVDSGERLDIWLSEASGFTRSRIQHLIRDGLVFVNGKLPKKTGDRLKANDKVEVLEAELSARTVAIQEKTKKIIIPRVEVVADTPDYLVINKPAGLIVHPGAQAKDKKSARESDTLTGWLLNKYPELWGVGEYSNRPGIVHRLDKDTSGLMVIARQPAMFQTLKQQFKNRTVEKIYTALVHGVIRADHDTLDFLIDRGQTGRMVSRPKIEKLTLSNVGHIQPGRTALTEFIVLKRFVNYTLLEINLHTGRTHQIRVHFFAYNHPVVGDPLYFNKKLKRDKDKELGRLFLHAGKLAFTDLKGEKKNFTASLPKELTQLLTTLK